MRTVGVAGAAAGTLFTAVNALTPAIKRTAATEANLVNRISPSYQPTRGASMIASGFVFST